MGPGLLVFKGDKKPKKKSKKSKHGNPGEKNESHAQGGGLTVNEATQRTLPAKAATAVTNTTAVPKIQKGNGLITTSGTVVTGHEGTRFMSQIRPGDALLAVVEPGAQEEMRVVTMRLSDVSLNLSSAYSQNLSTPTAYRYIPKPKSTAQIKREAQQATDEQEGDLPAATHRELVYREATEQGSYRMRRVQLDHEVTSGDLLEMRAKQSRDKYC